MWVPKSQKGAIRHVGLQKGLWGAEKAYGVPKRHVGR